MGFAVVASEVEELARAASVSTEDVRNRIGAIHVGIAKAPAIEVVGEKIQTISEISVGPGGAICDRRILPQPLTPRTSTLTRDVLKALEVRQGLG